MMSALTFATIFVRRTLARTLPSFPNIDGVRNLPRKGKAYFADQPSRAARRWTHILLRTGTLPKRIRGTCHSQDMTWSELIYSYLGLASVGAPRSHRGMAEAAH